MTVSLPIVQCSSWSPSTANPSCGLCARGLGGGHPGHGYCLLICDSYDGPADARRLPPVSIIEAPRPPVTFSRAKDWLEAMVKAGRVSDEVRQQREAICERCPHARIDDKGRWCSVCGCGTTDESRRIFNLAAFNEGKRHKTTGLPKWGCKHPDRAKGEGWPIINSQE